MPYDNILDYLKQGVAARYDPLYKQKQQQSFDLQQHLNDRNTMTEYEKQNLQRLDQNHADNVSQIIGQHVASGDLVHDESKDPTLTPAPAGNVSGSSLNPSAPQTPWSLLSSPQGTLTPTSNSASQNQTGALGQASIGSTTPSQTDTGATGRDSGPRPPATPASMGAGSQPSAPEASTGIKPQFVPGSFEDQVNKQGLRWATPDEKADRLQSQARQQAIAARQSSLANVTSLLARPELKDVDDFTKKSLITEAMTGQKFPEETNSQVEGDLMKKAQAALESGDQTKYQSYRELLQTHLTHGQNAAPTKLAVRPDGSVYQVQPGVTMGTGDKIVGEQGTDKQPTPQIGYVPIKDAQGNTTGYSTRVVRGGESDLPANMQSQAGVNTINTPTSSMRTRGEMSQSVIDQIPKITQEIDGLKDKLGPAAGRWNDFVVNKGGLNDPDFKHLNMDLQMLSSGLRVAHFGMRSGGEAYQQQLNRDFSTAQSPEDLKAVIDSAQGFLGGYAKFAKHPDFSSNEYNNSRPTGIPQGPIHPVGQGGNTDRTTALSPPPNLPKPLVKGQKIDRATAQKFVDAFQDRQKGMEAAQQFGYDISK